MICTLMSKNKSFIALEQNKKCSCKPSDLLDFEWIQWSYWTGFSGDLQHLIQYSKKIFATNWMKKNFVYLIKCKWRLFLFLEIY